MNKIQILALILLTAIFVQCKNETSRETTSTTVNNDGFESNKIMVKRLQEVFGRVNPAQVLYHDNDIRAEYYKVQMESPTSNADQKLLAQIKYGYELIMGGRNNEAIIQLEKAQQALNARGDQMAALVQVKRLLAMAYIRIGEQENCIDKNNRESCIIPIQGDGIYKLTKGPETAISLYKELLNINPNDAESKWMLNLAYMTIGRYPGDVPKEFLIPLSVFESNGNMKPFRNISNEVGLNTVALSGGAIVEDFNNDGLLDIIASSWGYRDQMQVFKNTGTGFENVTAQSDLVGMTSGLNMIHADFDNDGWVDILVLRGAWYGQDGKIPNSLLKNMGDFKFKDVTEEVGLLSYWPTQTATWADFNMDGWLDLFIGNESSPVFGAPSEFYINEKGSFRKLDTTKGIPVVSQFVKGCASGDIDNDGDPDLYISVMSGDNILLRNDSDGAEISFTDITSQAGVAKPFGSFPTWMWDYDNDGHLDILAASYDMRQSDVAGVIAQSYQGERTTEDKVALYRNNQNNTFTDIAGTIGLAEPMYVMGSNYGDVDNDGFPDMYLSTGAPSYTALSPNKMFRNANGKSFEDVTSVSRLGHIQKGHAVSFGDIDNDGDLDIFHVLGGAFKGDVFADALFCNPGYPEANWINVKLEGTSSNRSAIGAKIKIVAFDAKSGVNRTFYHLVHTGSSFGSNSLAAEIGLGNCSKIVSMDVTWPDKNSTTQTFTNIEPNQFIKIKQGTQNPEIVKVKTLKFDF